MSNKSLPQEKSILVKTTHQYSIRSANSGSGSTAVATAAAARKKHCSKYEYYQYNKTLQGNVDITETVLDIDMPFETLINQMQPYSFVIF